MMAVLIYNDWFHIQTTTSTYHKWMFKLQISSIFNFDRAHQSWISGVLGVKDKNWFQRKDDFQKLTWRTVRNSFYSLSQTQAKSAKVCIDWKQNASSSRVSKLSVKELCWKRATKAVKNTLRSRYGSKIPSEVWHLFCIWHSQVYTSLHYCLSS